MPDRISPRDPSASGKPSRATELVQKPSSDRSCAKARSLERNRIRWTASTRPNPPRLEQPGSVAIAPTLAPPTSAVRMKVRRPSGAAKVNSINPSPRIPERGTGVPLIATDINTRR